MISRRKDGGAYASAGADADAGADAGAGAGAGAGALAPMRSLRDEMTRRTRTNRKDGSILCEGGARLHQDIVRREKRKENTRTKAKNKETKGITTYSRPQQ